MKPNQYEICVGATTRPMWVWLLSPKSHIPSFGFILKWICYVAEAS